jgi:peptidoglycan/LPS O-acetylase OafA/YrhL
MTPWLQRPHSLWANALAYAATPLRFGEDAVMVFFVLSGFFIHLRFAAKAAESGKPAEVAFSASPYFARRAHRILPTYAFALLTTLLLDSLGHAWAPTLYDAHTGIVALDDNFSRKGYSQTSVFWALILLPSAMWRDFGSNGPLWSLGCEILYYALYPAWLWLRKAQGWLAYSLVLAFGLYAAAYLPGGPIKSYLKLYPTWIAGALLAEFICKRSEFPWRRGLALAAAGAGFAISKISQQEAVIEPARALMGVGLVALFLCIPQSVTSSLWHRAGEYFGKRSYTLYVCHCPLLVLFSALCFQYLGGLPSHGWIALAGFGVTVSFCMSCFEICERHFIHDKIKI